MRLSEPMIRALDLVAHGKWRQVDIRTRRALKGRLLIEYESNKVGTAKARAVLARISPRKIVEVHLTSQGRAYLDGFHHGLTNAEHWRRRLAKHAASSLPLPSTNPELWDESGNLR